MGSLVSVMRRRFWWLAVVLVLVGGCQSTASGPATDPGVVAPSPTPVAVIHEGLPGPDDDFPMLPSNCQSPTQPLPFKPCHITNYGSGRPTVAVWGDSHAWMYLPALRKQATNKHVNLVMILAGGCPPALPLARVPGQPYTECEVHDTLAMNYVRTVSARKPAFGLILGAFWSGYRAGYHGGEIDAAQSGRSEAYDQRLDDLAHDRTRPLFDALAHLDVDVDVIGQAATVPPDVATCAAGRDPYSCDVPRSSALVAEQSNRAWLKTMMKPVAAHARYIDTSSAYCDATECHPDVDGAPTWYDDIHLGKTATAKMAHFFGPAFDDVV